MVNVLSGITSVKQKKNFVLAIRAFFFSSSQHGCNFVDGEIHVDYWHFLHKKHVCVKRNDSQLASGANY